MKYSCYVEQLTEKLEILIYLTCILQYRLLHSFCVAGGKKEGTKDMDDTRPINPKSILRNASKGQGWQIFDARKKITHRDTINGRIETLQGEKPSRVGE